MRNVLAAALAVPVFAIVIAGDLRQRSGIRRLTAVAMALAIGAIAIVSTGRPEATTATPPSRVESPIAATEFLTEIATSESPGAPITVAFPAPMNTASVEQLLRISPLTTVDLAWDERGTLLTITPGSAWRTDTYHTVTIEAGALEASGTPLEQPVRAAFVTRPAVTSTVVATAPVGAEAMISTAFRVSFSGPVDQSTLDVLVTPAVEGRLVPAVAAGGTETDAAPAKDTGPEPLVFDFVPDDPLAPDTEYLVVVSPGTRDADGAAIESTALTVRTAAEPAVVRFRPRAGWADVAWTQDLSVRFTEPMDRASTEAAWTATEGTKSLEGAFSWHEGDTVLVFDPKATLGYGQKVTMTVATGAISKAGLPLQAAAAASFTTAKKPVPRPSGGGSSGGGGGGSVGAGTWAAVETYYLNLMNCTRTGGWVTSSGDCSSPGGRNVAPLWIDAGISSSVARPYAKKLAVNGTCSHFSGGSPGDRLRAAGYTSYIWAENLGCRSGDPYAAVLGSHLFFQSEQSYNGGHYVNLMNAKYDRVGIGVWVASGRVRLVVDFYHPL